MRLEPRTLQAPHENAAPVEDFSPSELERRDSVARMQIHRWLDKFGIDLASYRRDS